MNTFDDMDNAVRDAEQTLRVADLLVNRIAKMMVGRLRKVDRYGVLSALKRELQDYNARTQTWRDQA